MLAAAARFVADEELPNVTLIKDDLFATSLEPASFDLVHARFELTRSAESRNSWRPTSG